MSSFRSGWRGTTRPRQAGPWLATRGRVESRTAAVSRRTKAISIGTGLKMVVKVCWPDSSTRETRRPGEHRRFTASRFGATSTRAPRRWPVLRASTSSSAARGLSAVARLHRESPNHAPRIYPMKHPATCADCESRPGVLRCAQCDAPTCSDCATGETPRCVSCVESGEGWDHERDQPLDLTCAICRSADWGEGTWGEDPEQTFACGRCYRSPTMERTSKWREAGASPCIHGSCSTSLGKGERCPQHGLPSHLVFLGLSE